MSADGLTDDERRSLEKDNARRDVVKLVLVGVVLVVVGGIGVWFTKWDAASFGWYSLASDRDLLVSYECNADVRVSTDEFDDRVEISVSVRVPAHDEDCGNQVCIRLDRPLGDRAVIDGKTGRAAGEVPADSDGC